MHCSRAVAFGSEEASYYNLPKVWHQENVNERNVKNTATKRRRTEQILFPGGSNRPVGKIQPCLENPATALPPGTL